MTISEYSRHRGVTPEAVRAAILAGRITRGKDGSLDPAIADAEWARNTQRGGRKKGSINSPEVSEAAGVVHAKTLAELKARQAEMLDPRKLGKLSMNDARALKENFDAELKFIEVQKQKSKLLDRDEVVSEIAKLHRVHRDALLNIPSRLAAQIATLTEVADIHDVIAEEIRDALEELSLALARIAEGNPQ